MTNASNRNYVVGNSMTHSGDGFFLAGFAEGGTEARQTPQVSRLSSNDNVIAYNDGSWSPANAFEGTFSSGNIYYRNWANDSSYGFWLGCSRDSMVLQNRVQRNVADGVAIEHGSGNRIEGNVFSTSGNAAVHLWGDSAGGGEPRASTNNEVRDNVFQTEKRPLDIPDSTGCYVGGNRLIGTAALPPPASAAPPDTVTALRRFRASEQHRKLQSILAARPKHFSYYRERPGPFGMEWFALDDYSPRGWLDQPAAYRSTGWSSLELWLPDPKATKVVWSRGVEIEQDRRVPNLVRFAAAAPTGGIGALRPYRLTLTRGAQSQTIAGDLIAADWKVRWFRWDMARRPEPGDGAGWGEIFSGKPLAQQTLRDTTWSLGCQPPAPVSDGPYALEASARVKLPAGRYRLACGCDGGARMLVDGAAVFEGWLGGDHNQLSGTAALSAGVHELVIQHLRSGGPTRLKLFWGRAPLR
jgi:parallel beta-helix repeat protein